MNEKELNRRARRIEKDLRRLLIALKPDIADEYRESADDLPGIDITIGIDADCHDWSYQTGDNSYTGGAYSYSHWGVGRLYRRSNCVELAARLVADACEQIETTETAA